MLPASPRTVSEAIIGLFQQHTALTAAAIHGELLRGGRNTSRRAIFKELHKLLERGVIVRVQGRYSLSLTWVLSLIDFSESLFQRFIGQARTDVLLPAAEEKHRWVFSDLQRMDQFWLQLMFLLFEKSSSRVMCEWLPHFWFHLLHYGKELEAQRAMKRAGNRLYMIIGAKTFLDLQPSAYWDRRVYDWSYASGPFEGESSYFCVIDDYVLTVKLDSKTSEQIDSLFRRVRSARDMESAAFVALFKQKVSAVLTLERNEKKACKLLRRFGEFFGIKPAARQRTLQQKR
jgi:hypothetical protein